MKTLHVAKTIHGSPLRRGLLFIPLLFGCFALSPAARAVLPAPDGGYPGGNTAVQFIENLFGISPDGGSGLLECSLIAVPLGILVLRAVLKTCHQLWRYLHHRLDIATLDQ